MTKIKRLIITILVMIGLGIPLSTAQSVHAQGLGSTVDNRVAPNTGLTYRISVSYESTNNRNTSDFFKVIDDIPEELILNNEAAVSFMPASCDERIESDEIKTKFEGHHFELDFKGELMPGCTMNIDIVTETPSDETSVMMSNTAILETATGDKVSNVISAQIGEVSEKYKLSYRLEAGAPEKARARLVSDTNYMNGAVAKVSGVNMFIPGYTFLGWFEYDAENDTIANIPSTTIFMDSDKVLVGKYERNELKKTIHYRIEGDSFGDYLLPQDEEFYYGERVVLNVPRVGISMDLYEYRGFYAYSTEAECEAVTKNNDICIIRGDTNVDMTYELMAGEEFDITYEFYGDIPEEIQQIATERYQMGDSVVLMQVPEVEGYIFKGWEVADLDLAGWDEGLQSFTIYDNVTIRGAWVKTEAFTPSLSITIDNPKNYYTLGSDVIFTLNVSNTNADYEILNTKLVSLLDDVEFIPNDGYAIDSDGSLIINSIGAGDNLEIKAKMNIRSAQNFTHVITFAAEITDAELSKEGAWFEDGELNKDSASFNIKGTDELPFTGLDLSQGEKIVVFVSLGAVSFMIVGYGLMSKYRIKFKFAKLGLAFFTISFVMTFVILAKNTDQTSAVSENGLSEIIYQSAFPAECSVNNLELREEVESGATDITLNYPKSWTCGDWALVDLEIVGYADSGKPYSTRMIPQIEDDDVIVRGVWAKYSIEMSADGTLVNE